ncbi:hypothetical protein Tco_0801455 [Tanacetum coccineum]|uniref:Uncharacterized protein n=1 Tax=Tanacetum coccineum TaxID=301880 RepID=A0ABQ4ZWV5_9ASTR
MSWSNIAGGKNWLTKACLISSQVVITPGLRSLNQILASPARDDGKSFSLMAFALMVSFDDEVVSKVNRDNSDPGSGCYGPIVSPHRYSSRSEMKTYGIHKSPEAGISILAGRHNPSAWPAGTLLLPGGRLSSRAAGMSLVESFCWISRLMLLLELCLAVGLCTLPYLYYNLISGLGSLSN